MHESGDSSPCPQSVEPAPDEPEPPDGLAITIVDEGGDWSAFPARGEAIRAAGAAVAAHPRGTEARGAEACIVLADDALVRSLNRSYRGKDAPTNVLSFPFQEPPGAPSTQGGTSPAAGAGTGPRHLGDVVLAAETVGGEAAAQELAPAHHLQHLVVHGLLHLLGFDHETDAEAEVMEGLEVEILASLGIADPYAAADGR